jgi:hypothetical protein
MEPERMTAPANKLDGATMTALTRERRASLEWAIEAAVTKGYTADADVIRDLLSELLSASKPVVPENWKLVPDHENPDAIVTSLYRRFKDWRKRCFGPDDVTWCEIKADVLAMLAASSAAPAQSGKPVALSNEHIEEIQTSISMLKTRAWPGDLYIAAHLNLLLTAPLSSRPAESAVVLDDERAEVSPILAPYPECSFGYVICPVNAGQRVSAIIPAPHPRKPRRRSQHRRSGR